LRSTIEAHIVEKPLGTRNSLLLKKITEAAGLTDRDYYLTNVVKCAGPVKPAKEFNANANTCIDLNLRTELALINPTYVVCLGVGVAKFLYGDKTATVESTYKYDEMTTLVTYSMEELYRHGAAYFNHAVETFKKAKLELKNDITIA
jgi:uracil-DNA glycosylase family 4